METPTIFNKRVIFALSFTNFIGFFYISFVSPLLPVFVNKFSLTLTQVGFLTGISRFLAFIVEPSVGYIADHHRTRLFVLGGPILAIVSISLIGIVPSYWFLILCTSFGIIGASMFYPSSVGMVSLYSGRHFGLSLTIIEMGGILGFGLGPIFITHFVEISGLRTIPFTMLPGLATMIILFRAIPVPQEKILQRTDIIGSIKEVFGGVWKLILLLWVVMVLRSFIAQYLFTFLPLLFSKEGYSLTTIGMMMSILTLSGAISTPLAGHLSDRIGYKRIIYFVQLMTALSLFFLLFLSRNWIYLSVFLTGFFLFPTLPLGIAMAQRLAPKGKSTASSLMAGMTFGTAATIMPIAGKFADLFSIRAVLTFVVMIPLLIIGLLIFVPERV